MKKFLSICLVALCSVSAMYAQETPTSEVTYPNEVECGSTVTVSATAKNKHFNFDHWEIKNDANGNSIANNISPNPTTPNPDYVTNCQTSTPNGDGIETNVLTVALDQRLIDLVSTVANNGTLNIGTLRFEAFFTEENWYIINAAIDNGSEGLGSVSQTPNDGKVYHDESVTLTATHDDCVAFLGWKDENGTIVSTDEVYTVSPDLNNWQANSSTPHIYKAVFAKKKVNIKVTTDNTKGTVTISVNGPAANPQP